MKIKRAVRGARQAALPIAMTQIPSAASLDPSTRQVVVAVLAKILLEAVTPYDEATDERS